MARPEHGPAAVGVSDHSGWAILVTASARGALIDRRRIEIVDAGLPTMPHHHDGQRLPISDAVALVTRVRASAERNARARLAALARELPAAIGGIALRVCPTLPATVAERIQDYRAMCVADWVMYRQAFAAAATELGWALSWYEPKRVFAEAASALAIGAADAILEAPRSTVGAPWQKDHKLAMAAAIVAANAAR